MNEKALTNQVEYAIYNEKREKLNLSYCRDVKLKVNYEIKDQSALNKTMIDYYSELGVDIFDREDSFFTDLCYPFSFSDSDIILKDRVLDIYQNYSLCDNNCIYNEINIENKIVTCSCIGFFILIILIIINIFLLIYYFIYGINSIKIFIFKEMEKYNFISIINQPIKKKKIKNKKKYKLSKNFLFLNEKGSLSNSYNKTNDLLRNNSKKINLSKNNDMSPFKQQNKHSINNILIFNYNNNKVIRRNKTHKKKTSKANHNIIYNNEEGKTFPGFYNLIQINPNNNPNNEPFDSKYILDNYNYETAMIFEKRSFWRIYYICLLSKENILNTFFFKSPLESQSLRLSLFLFNYSCDLAFNALFYFTQNISDKYHYKGNNLFLFTIVNNFIISVISTLSTFILVYSLNFLTNSKDKILSIFREKEYNTKDEKIYKINIKSKRKIYEEIILYLNA
jgi:hypothetical protein